MECSSFRASAAHFWNFNDLEIPSVGYQLLFTSVQICKLTDSALLSLLLEVNK